MRMRMECMLVPLNRMGANDIDCNTHVSTRKFCSLNASEKQRAWFYFYYSCLSSRALHWHNFISL